MPLEPLVITADQLAELGICLTNQRRLQLEAAGKLPARISIGSRTTGYLYAEIKAWLADQAANREAGAAVRSRAARKTAATRLARRAAAGGKE